MPPELDANQEDLQSSEQVEDVTEASPEQSEETGAADPSPAKDEPEDMLSVVRDVVSKPEETASSAEESAEDADAAKADADPKDKAEADDPDYSDVPFHNHPRFKKLLAQKKEFEADAGQFRTVQEFLKQNSLSSDEAAEGLQLMAMMKSDPRKALDALKPHIQKLLEATGETLPADLRERVQRGDLPLEAAKEISRSRADVAHTRETREREEQRRQEEMRSQQAMGLRNTAVSWLEDRATRDPSFEAKRPMLEREIAFMHRQEGVPSTPEGVRDQLQRAYSEVNRQARVVAPAAKPAVRPVTGGTAPGNPAPRPTSMLEAMKAASGVK